MSKVSLENEGPEIAIERGVRQGDPMLPKLFIAVLEDILQKIKWKNKEIQIMNKNLSHLRFVCSLNRQPK